MKIDFSDVIQIAENYQPLKDWGFTLSVKHEGYPESWLIYTSQWCKINIHHRKDFNHQSPEDYLNIFYGRVHALDDSLTMEHEGQKYHCWLDSGYRNLAFKYLEGQSPEEAIQLALGFPQWYQEYLDNTPKPKNQTEELLIYNKGYWDHYGSRFFELLDIRRTDLWNGYINFLKAYAKLKHEEDERLRERDAKKVEAINAKFKINVANVSSEVPEILKIPLYNLI